MKVDVLVIGGGPAGLAAAYETASRGAKTVIVDESWSLGGQLRQQTQVLDSLTPPWEGLRGYELAAKLADRLENLSVDTYLKHSVLGVYADQSIGISDNKTLVKISASSIIVATGAAETPVAFPGWTSPGVMTVGAAQILINRERVYPGQKALIVGSGDLALEVAAQMKAVGIEVAALVEKSGQVTAIEHKNLEYLSTAQISVHLQSEVTEVQASKKRKKVVILGKDSSKMEYEVDFICIDGGRHPIIEPLAVLNCSLSYRPAFGGWTPAYNLCCQSSVPNVFVAGNTAGVTCHGGILLTGKLAGIGAAEYLKKAEQTSTETQRKALWQELYELEAARYPQIWQDRVSLLSDFTQTALPDAPENWRELLSIRR